MDFIFTLAMYHYFGYNTGGMEIYDVELSVTAKKQLRLVPNHIQNKFYGWVKAVAKQGLRTIQKIPGYHDEPLRGRRHGQRSIRLNQAYRAIYVIKDNKEIEFIFVEKVNKHDYK